MRDFSTVADRAKFIAIDLIGKTASNIQHDIYISAYTFDGETKYSIRLNEFDNRINDLEFTLAFFVADELTKRNYVTVRNGLNLTKAKTQMFWPRIRNIQNIFQKFSSAVAIANNELRQELVISKSNDWKKQMTFQVAL
jgi:hypothetical protein